MITLYYSSPHEIPIRIRSPNGMEAKGENNGVNREGSYEVIPKLKNFTFGDPTSLRAW